MGLPSRRWLHQWKPRWISFRLRTTLLLLAVSLAWYCSDPPAGPGPMPPPPPPPPVLSDRDILVALYEATGGSAWDDNTNWLTDAPLREWYGVDTNIDGTVTELILFGNNLRGRLPPEIGQLEALTILDLDYNWLRGPVPGVLGDLSRLRILSLHGNLLEGSIPEALGTLSELEQLKLGDNRLTGPIPPELGDLSHLTNLSLEENNLSGPIPRELGDLSNLMLLLLSANDLSGPIPPGSTQPARCGKDEGPEPGRRA